MVIKFYDALWLIIVSIQSKQIYVCIDERMELIIFVEILIACGFDQLNNKI